MKNFYTLALLVLLTSSIFSQSYQGPATGNLSAGIMQSTETLDKSVPMPKRHVFDRPEVKLIQTIPDFGKPTPPEGSNYVQDNGVFGNQLLDSDTLLKSFFGIDMGNSIPPDPTMAVGPGHVIAAVNGSFRIWDKEGNVLRTISDAAWIGKSVTNADVVTDPKVVYDHFSKRFIMVWMTVNTTAQTSYWVISVSKDSVPVGTWYTWATPSNVNGNSNSNNYSDYQGVGFDKDAIYICGNQFGFTGGFQYAKFRIIPKAQLLNNTPNAITWTDFWDIRMPQGQSTQAFGIRPTITFGETSEAYLVWTYPYSTANFFSLYRVQNPLSTTPTITGVNIPVTSFTVAPNANQLGGIRQYTIETLGSKLTNEAVYRDGNIWITHAVRNPVDTSVTSAIHYMKFDVATNTAVEDVVYGSNGFWYYFPTLMVDKEKNLTISYSRSGFTEYIGAFYSSKKATDAVLGPSKTLQSGKGNYEVVYSGTRNRWGDYMGIALDPVDESSIWMHTEYASATNKWATYIGKMLVKPIEGAYLSTASTDIDLGLAPVSWKGDTAKVVFTNLGSQSITITSIPSVGPFKVLNTFPITLGTYASVEIKISYEPTVVGTNSEFLPIASNATNITGLNLKGFAFILAQTELNALYASTGSSQNGELHKLNVSTGASTLVGSTTVSEVRAISIDPKTRKMYGMSSSATGTNFLGLDGAAGTAYKIFTLPVIDMKAMAFDTLGQLYAASRLGQIYRVDLATRKYTPVCSVKTPLISLAFHPKTNNLWGVSSTVIGVKDRLFRINLSNGDTTQIARTGTNQNSNALAFDNSGKIYVATGAVSSANDLYLVDTVSSTSVLIGSTNIKNITDFAFSTSSVSGIEDYSVSHPGEFILAQNYPNPFNPATIIQYALPKEAMVKITIYNVLGQKVTELVNSTQQAGSYYVNWNASNFTSGIYFYEMKATGEGTDFTSFKKMILIK